MGLLSKIGDKLGGSSSAEHDERSEVDHNQPGSHLRHPIQSHTGPTGTAVSHSTDPSTSFSSSTQPGGQYAAPGSYPSESTREGYSSSQPLGTSGDHGLASQGQIHGSSTGASGLTGHTGQHQSSTRSDYPTSSHSGNEGLASTGTGIASSGSGIGSTGLHSQSGTSHTGAHGIGSTSVDDSVPRSKHGGITNSSQNANTPAPDFGPTSGKENLHAIPTAGGQKVGTGVDAAETPYGAQPQHGNDLHDSHSGSHGHSHHARHHEAQEHHLARDAAVAATGGAGAGIGAHEHSKHGDHHQHAQGSTLDQKYPHAAGQTGQGLSSLPGQQGQSTSHHSGHGEHHGARDAALGAGALGVAGHEADKHNTHGHSTTSGLSSSTGSQLPGRSEYNQPSTSQAGHSGQLASQEHTGHSHHQRHHDAQQHHGARDTALGAGAGAGAAGIAAHELSHHSDHSAQRDQAGQYPSQTTSHHSGPLSSHHAQSSTQPFTSDLSTQQAGRDYDPYRDASSKKDLTDPANVSYMNRSAVDPHGSSSVPHGQTGANFAGSNVATDLPHHPKPSHLGQEAGLAAAAGGTGALAGAGLAEGKHHGRYDSATQHNLSSGATAAQTAGGQTTHSDADLPPHISGFLHAQKVGGQYEAGYRAALAHLHQAKQLGV